MELDLEMEDGPMLSLRSVEDRTYTATDVKGAKNVLSRGHMVLVKKIIKQNTWQDNITAHRMEDENVELPECFNWSVKWKSAPTYTICAINERVQQLSRTRVREEMMGKATRSTCRICHQFPETVEHILAGCPGLAQRQYLGRHNDALKHVLNVILLHYGLRGKPSDPYQPNSYYCNDEIEIMLDCSITTSSRPPEEGNRPDICVTNHTNKELEKQRSNRGEKDEQI